ncbi:MAG: hypothetical protein J6E44_02075 [Lachnospiraceae bacterium]|nr:hypothetical protein [Lachnospiraceae bacterium]
MMKRLIQIIKRKRNQNGESMAEVLVAALIIELALIAAVSMIISAGRIIVKSKEHYDQYFVRQNALASDSVPGSEIEIDDTQQITITASGSDPVINPIPISLKTVTADDSSKAVYYYEPR